jgi:UDP-glucose 4-epimerase
MVERMLPHLLALKALKAGQPGRPYNLGNGRGFSVNEVIEVARQVTRRAVAVKVGPPRPGDPACLVGDSTLIRSELGWQPQYAELATIVETAWRWHQRAMPAAAP